jgi:hypothetical protein
VVLIVAPLILYGNVLTSMRYEQGMAHLIIGLALVLGLAGTKFLALLGVAGEKNIIMKSVVIFISALFGWGLFAGATNFLASNVVGFITLNEVVLFLAYLAQAYLLVRRIEG